ncbi:MAG: ABC-2 transporter permease [Lachnospiraceae bacterium]|nr:ABC-2 transporter permease [Lachnospiraceae bacterium]
MKAFKFMKIDYIKTKHQMLITPLALLAVVGIMMAPDSDIREYSAVVPFCYMVFMMIIFSCSPFGSCRREETGFLQLLPATTRDRVAGRFLYGISLITIAAVLGMGAIGIGRMFGVQINALDVPLCLVAFAIGIFIMTAEYVFFYLFGENTAQNLLGIVRVLPGMCFFFVTANLSKEIIKDPDKLQQFAETVGRYLNIIGGVSVVASLIMFVAAIWLCAAITDKRDS